MYDRSRVQSRSLGMLPRCARTGVFDDPNRWFLVKFSYCTASRALAAEEGVSADGPRHSLFAEESNFNLLSVTEVRAIGAQISGFVFDASAVSLWAWPGTIRLNS